MFLLVCIACFFFFCMFSCHDFGSPENPKSHFQFNIKPLRHNSGSGYLIWTSWLHYFHSSTQCLSYWSCRERKTYWRGSRKSVILAHFLKYWTEKRSNVSALPFRFQRLFDKVGQEEKTRIFQWMFWTFALNVFFVLGSIIEKCEMIHLTVLIFQAKTVCQIHKVPPWSGNKFILALTSWKQQNKSSLDLLAV